MYFMCCTVHTVITTCKGNVHHLQLSVWQPCCGATEKEKPNWTLRHTRRCQRPHMLRFRCGVEQVKVCCRLAVARSVSSCACQAQFLILNKQKK